MSNRERRFEVDEVTGEVKEFVEVREGDVLRTQKQNEYHIKQARRYDDKTEFVWVKFPYNKQFYSSLQPSNITRLMYFATFCNSEGYVMRNNDVKGMLNINANQLKSFRDELLEREIINVQKTRIYLNQELFGKGEVDKPLLDYTRLFTSATRSLYEGCHSTTTHKYLSYIFKMIPYVNRQTNILCCNQQEQVIESIALMPFVEFYENQGNDKTHASRLKKALQEFRIDGELVVGFFNTLDELTPSGKYVVVNPKLFYGGDRTQEPYSMIRNLFLDEAMNNA